MRTIAILLLLSTPVAAQDYQDLYKFYQRQRAEKAARIASHESYMAREEAKQKALCDKIGGVKDGMDSEAVLKSGWNEPHRKNKTETADHEQQQWVYGGSYLYLTDGIVTAIQTHQ